MGMFFSEHGIKDGEPKPEGPPPSDNNYRVGVNPRDGLPFIDSTCVDGTSLVTKLQDDPSIPVGQVFMVHPMGLIDYNEYIDHVTKPEGA